MRKPVSCLLLLLLCWSPAVSSASAYSVTEAQLTELESIFSELRTVNETLLAGSNQSVRDLIEAREQLKRLQDELTKLKEQLQGLKEESSQAQSILAKANEELKLASESYKKSVSETKGKIRSLEWQRGVLVVVAGFLAVRR